MKTRVIVLSAVLVFATALTAQTASAPQKSDAETNGQDAVTQQDLNKVRRDVKRTQKDLRNATATMERKLQKTNDTIRKERTAREADAKTAAAIGQKAEANSRAIEDLGSAQTRTARWLIVLAAGIVIACGTIAWWVRKGQRAKAMVLGFDPEPHQIEAYLADRKISQATFELLVPDRGLVVKCTAFRLKTSHGLQTLVYFPSCQQKRDEAVGLANRRKMAVRLYEENKLKPIRTIEPVRSFNPELQPMGNK